VKNFIRRADFHQIPSAMETGADHSMWTFTRYKNWMAKKKDWHVPNGAAPLATSAGPSFATKPELQPI
jgi:twitching motility protein PilT